MVSNRGVLRVNRVADGRRGMGEYTTQNQATSEIRGNIHGDHDAWTGGVSFERLNVAGSFAWIE